MDTPLYRADIPNDWPISPRETLIADTKKPICSIHLDDLDITIHDFPEMLIPPQAQVQRWIGQLNGKDSITTPTTHSGFVGLLLESDNLLAAAFQLAPHYSSRNPPSSWTIKAVGEITKYREELIQLIHSFELIGPLE